MKIGFIDYYLDEWHANNYPAWIDQASDGEMQVAYAFGMIDSPLPGGRTTAQWCQDMGIERVDSIERLIELSDALVVLSPDNCEMHEALCQLPLRSKKPTYVIPPRLCALRPSMPALTGRAYAPSPAGARAILKPILFISWSRS